MTDLRITNIFYMLSKQKLKFHMAHHLLHFQTVRLHLWITVSESIVTVE